MEYDDLIRRLSDALDRGDVEPGAVEALLRRAGGRHRPDAAGILRASGLLVCFAGAALLYGIGFASYPESAQATTPFLFPAVALIGAVLAHRAGRPAFEIELAGMAGYVAFGLASLTAAVVTGGGSSAGIVASITGAAIVLVLHRLLHVVRLTGWGLTASLVAFTGFSADVGGLLDASTVPWWLVLQGVAGVAAGALLLRRGSRAGAEASWRSAATLAVVGATAGIVEAQSGALGPWHALLTVAVSASLLAAARFDLPSLMWVGALGSLVWLGALAVVVGQSAGWAVAVILFGAGLVAVATLVARRRRRPAALRPAV
jgi:hypothetical protein